MELAGKRGVVFGVANKRSIAWAIAQACVARGAQLVFAVLDDRTEDKVAPLVSSLTGEHPIWQCDVQDDGSLDGFFERTAKHFDEVDFLIHSVAFAQREDLAGRFVDTSRGGFATAMDVSAYSLVAMARRAVPLMSAGASIVAMTYLGSMRVFPGYNVMGVAKAALEASVRYLAADLGPSGVRVNAISAGPVQTLSARGIAGFTSILDHYSATAPLRRPTAADEVGDTAAFLVSDGARGITGEVLYVDSGYHAVGM